MNNYFNNAPTVGSTDSKPSYDGQQERIYQLEQRLTATEAQVATQKVEEKPSRFKWFKKIGKFFNNYIKPVVDTISRLLSSIASVKKAFA